MPDSGDDFRSADVGIALLGPPQVLVRGDPIVLPRRQTRGLMYYLAATPTPVPRGRLCALFWPDVPEADARRNLTHLLTLLRHALPAPTVIIKHPEAVALDPHRIWSDIQAFTRLTSTGDLERPESLREAIGLWRGPFLDGFDAGGSDIFEDWVAQQRTWWERRYLEALARLIDAEAGRGAYPAAIELAHRYLAVDDLAEEVHRRLMRLYAATDDRAAALHQFERCEATLTRELGIPPATETRALYEQLLAGGSPVRRGARLAQDLPATKRVLSHLPAPAAHLIGRDVEVRMAVSLLLRPDVRLLTLTGAGGVGKSRLALAIAAAVEPAFADGAIFVPLAPLGDPALVLRAIAQSLGLRESPRAWPNGSRAAPVFSRHPSSRSRSGRPRSSWNPATKSSTRSRRPAEPTRRAESGQRAWRVLAGHAGPTWRRTRMRLSTQTVPQCGPRKCHAVDTASLAE